MSNTRNTPLLEFAGIGKVYTTESGERVEALDGLDLRIGAGEFVVLLGPTGCGKTTALNLALALDRPDEGTVTLGSALERGLNMPCVFQHYTLFPWRSILHNVAFGLEMRSVPRRERNEHALGLLESVGLAQFADSRPHELSGGMRQRAAIAQALAVEPALLLMDEPFGALDDKTRGELQSTLTELWREQSFATLFVTHSIDEAIMLAGRIVLMTRRPGRIAREFAVDLARPRDPTSPDFVELLIEIREALAEQ